MSFLNPGGGNATNSTTQNFNDSSQHNQANSNNAADDHSYNLGDSSAVDARQSTSTETHDYQTNGGSLTVTDGGALAQVLDFAKNIFGVGGAGAAVDKTAHEYVPGAVAAPMNWKPWAIGGGAVLVVGVVVLVVLKRRKRG